MQKRWSRITDGAPGGLGDQVSAMLMLVVVAINYAEQEATRVFDVDEARVGFESLGEGAEVCWRLLGGILRVGRVCGC